MTQPHRTVYRPQPEENRPKTLLKQDKIIKKSQYASSSADLTAARSKSKRGAGGGAGLLHGRAPLQVLFDLCRVLPVEALGLFVELGVPLVDVVDVCVVVVGPAPAVLGPLIDPAIASKKADWRWPPRRCRHPRTMARDQDRGPGINAPDRSEPCGGGKQTRTRKTRPNFATPSLQSIVVRHSLATVSGSNAPQLCLQHSPLTVSHVGQPRGNRQIKGDLGLTAMGEIRSKKVSSRGMFGPRARRHQAVPCEAPAMVVSTCTRCCCDDGPGRDNHPALGD